MLPLAYTSGGGPAGEGGGGLTIGASRLAEKPRPRSHLMNIISQELNLYYFGITSNPVMQPDCDCRVKICNNIIICKANVKIQIMLQHLKKKKKVGRSNSSGMKAESIFFFLPPSPH